MGKPSAAGPPAYRDEEDALSLHSQPGPSYADHDDDDAPELHNDDLPPLYTDIDQSNNGASVLPSTGTIPAHQIAHAAAYPTVAIDYFYKDGNTGAEYYLSRSLNDNPETLAQAIEAWAAVPPRPSVRVLGTHQETRDNNGKKERKRVTDFDVSIDLTPYLFTDVAHRLSWRSLRTPEQTEKTRRGTVFKKRAPHDAQSIEANVLKPTLSEWCHRYCASYAGLKAFTLRRRMIGFDREKVKNKLESLVRGTNYRGSLAITFPVKDDVVEVYNDCLTNRWRLTNWVFWIFALSMLWIFSWPYLFFRTKRFEVAFAEWPFSAVDESGRPSYVSISEDQWYNMWGRAIGKAVLEKRQGMLDQQDLVNAEGGGPVIDTGNATADSVLSFFRVGVNAMNEVNRQLGWGYDT